jgi:hypothetical protein
VRCEVGQTILKNQTNILKTSRKFLIMIQDLKIYEFSKCNDDLHYYLGPDLISLPAALLYCMCLVVESELL